MFLKLILARIIFYFIITEVNTLEDMFTTPSSKNEYDDQRQSGFQRYSKLRHTDYLNNFRTSGAESSSMTQDNKKRKIPTYMPEFLLHPNHKQCTNTIRQDNEQILESNASKKSNPDYTNLVDLADPISPQNHLSYEKLFNDYNPTLSYMFEEDLNNVGVTSAPQFEQESNRISGKNIESKEHRFYKIAGLSKDVRQRCLPCSRLNKLKLVTTKCSGCDCYICGPCHAAKHNLDYIPTVATKFGTDQICHFCGKNLGTEENNLVLHSSTCKKLEIDYYNPFVCYKCGLPLKSDYLCKKHIRTHVGEMPHKCKICTFESRSKKELIEHMIKQHKTNRL